MTLQRDAEMRLAEAEEEVSHYKCWCVAGFSVINSLIISSYTIARAVLPYFAFIPDTLYKIFLNSLKVQKNGQRKMRNLSRIIASKQVE